MMSLPLVFETTRESVPNDPYIRAEPAKVAHWRKYLDKASPAPNSPWVGMCWHAGKNSWSADNHFTSKRKSLTFDMIEPLLSIDHINFLSLQVGDDSKFKNPGIKSFSDTAALIELMDVVITVDTAVANLAGAMGKPTWVLNRYDMCWRYVPIPTPWFPSVVSYTQPEPKEWTPVLIQIWDDLLKIRDKLAA
jgi:ADP-heptose:LPS heptosyltransferase